MYSLLISELNYFKRLNSGVVIGCTIAFIITWLGAKPENHAPLLMLITLVGVWMAAFSGERGKTMDKLERFYCSFPLRLTNIAAIRLLYPFIIWLLVLSNMFICFALVIVLKRVTQTAADFQLPSIMQLLVLTGWILTMNAIYIILGDLRRAAFSSGRKLLVAVVRGFIPLIFMIPFYILFNFLGIFRSPEVADNSLILFSDSVKGAVFSNLMGILISVGGIMVFLKKRSYLV